MWKRERLITQNFALPRNRKGSKCYLDSCYVLSLNNTGYFEVWDPPCTLGWSHTNTFVFFSECALTVSNISMLSFFLNFIWHKRD